MRRSWSSTFVAGALLVLLVASSSWGRPAAAQDIEATPPGRLPLAEPATGVLPIPPSDWPQFGGDPAHTGVHHTEALLGPTNVGLSRLLWRTPSTATTGRGAVGGTPISVSQVPTATGVRDLIVFTTRSATLVAVDRATGNQVWTRAFPYPDGTCHYHGDPTLKLCFTESSPAYDDRTGTVYTYGLDGIVHGVRIADGTDSGFAKASTLKPANEKGTSALAMATAKNGHRYLYVASSGYPDPPGSDYQGHVTTFDLTTGTETVFNVMCSDRTFHFTEVPAESCASNAGSVWSRPGVVYDDHNDRILLTTGNAPFDPAQHLWGDTVIALHADGTGESGGPVDSYTPTNHLELGQNDVDLGSLSTAILPAPPGSAVAHVGLQGGKDLKLRLLDLDDLSGQHGPGHVGGELSITQFPYGAWLYGMPTVWVDPADGSTWVFVGNTSGVVAYKLVLGAGNVPQLEVQWQKTISTTTAMVANGLLYLAGTAPCFYDCPSTPTIGAYDVHTGTQLWHDTTLGQTHWQSPVVADGVVLIGDNDGALSAYGVTGTGFTPVTPQRLLDSRGSVGGWGATPLVAGSPRALDVVSASATPATVRAAVLNVTVTGSTANTFVSARPSDAPATSTSLSNVGAGQTIANLATVAVGRFGSVTFSTASGATDLVVDLVGYYDDAAPALFTPRPATRILDSRTAVGDWGAALAAGSPKSLVVRGRGGVPPGATAVAANLTVTEATANSFVSVSPDGAPAGSSINFARGETIANMITLPIGVDGSIQVANAIGAVDVIVDVVGYYQPGTGLRFHPTVPTRVLDDRVGVGATGPWAQGQTRTVPIPIAGGVGEPPVVDPAAVVLNLTATNGTKGSYVSVVPPDADPALSSTLNFGAGQTIAHGSLSASTAHAVKIFNNTGSVDLVADLQGYFTAT
jgi:hypothetical protein